MALLQEDVVSALRRVDELGPDPAEPLIVACRRAPFREDGHRVLTVPCLSALTAPVMAHAALSSAGVLLAMQGCVRCEDRSTLRSLRAVMESGRRLASLFDDRGISIRCVEGRRLPKPLGRPPTPAVASLAGRRGFLKALTFRMLPDLPAAPSRGRGRDAMPRRPATSGREIIRFLRARGSIPVGAVDLTGLPIGSISLDPGTCIGCTVCEHSCPTSAIERTVVGDVVKLYFHADRCSSCNACVESCYAGAVHLHGTLDLSPAVNGDRILLASLARRECAECGAEFHSQGPALCPRHRASPAP